MTTAMQLTGFNNARGVANCTAAPAFSPPRPSEAPQRPLSVVTRDGIDRNPKLDGTTDNGVPLGLENVDVGQLDGGKDGDIDRLANNKEMIKPGQVYLLIGPGNVNVAGSDGKTPANGVDSVMNFTDSMIPYADAMADPKLSGGVERQVEMPSLFVIFDADRLKALAEAHLAGETITPAEVTPLELQWEIGLKALAAARTKDEKTQDVNVEVRYASDLIDIPTYAQNLSFVRAVAASRKKLKNPRLSAKEASRALKPAKIHKHLKAAGQDVWDRFWSRVETAMGDDFTLGVEARVALQAQMIAKPEYEKIDTGRTVPGQPERPIYRKGERIPDSGLPFDQWDPVYQQVAEELVRSDLALPEVEFTLVGKLWRIMPTASRRLIFDMVESDYDPDEIERLIYVDFEELPEALQTVATELMEYEHAHLAFMLSNEGIKLMHGDSEPKSLQAVLALREADFTDDEEIPESAFVEGTVTTDRRLSDLVSLFRGEMRRYSLPYRSLGMAVESLGSVADFDGDVFQETINRFGQLPLVLSMRNLFEVISTVKDQAGVEHLRTYIEQKFLLGNKWPYKLEKGNKDDLKIVIRKLLEEHFLPVVESELTAYQQEIDAETDRQRGAILQQQFDNHLRQQALFLLDNFNFLHADIQALVELNTDMDDLAGCLESNITQLESADSVLGTKLQDRHRQMLKTQVRLMKRLKAYC